MMFRLHAGPVARQCSPAPFVSLRRAIRLGATALLLGCLTLGASAADYYVAPTATSSGTGSSANPWTLATAFGHPSAVKPGDTIWLKAGTYLGVFNSRLTGTSSAPIKVRVLPGERAILDSKTLDVYKPTLTVGGSYTWYWGFEILNSSGKRISSQSGSWPSDIPHNGGIVTANAGTGNKFLNLLVHDTPFGVGMWNGASHIETYGCVVYYNGWKGPDRPHGHGVYAQNTAPSVKSVEDCLLFYNADHGAQFYGTTSAAIDNFNVSGNIIFNNSDLFAGTTSGRNLLVGGGAVARNPIILSNGLYRTPANFGMRTSDFFLGYGTGSENTLMRGNYLVGSAQFSGSKDVNLTCDNNLFYGPLTSLDKTKYPNNTFTTTRPSGVKVLVRPNRYEPGRANIGIYNWDKLASVNVPVTGLLNAGDTYELRNAMNYHGDIITGTYNGGGSIAVPMTGRTIAAPIGIPAPVSPFPEFGAFVLLKKSGGTVTNTPPSISSFQNQTIPTGGSTSPLAFTVGDAQTAAGSLTVTASSSNTALIPASGLVLGGTGSNRTLTVTAAAGQTGTATTTVTVTDGSLSASTSFTVTVVNTAPLIASIIGQTIGVNSSTGPLAFSVSDAETAAGSLTVTAASSNTTLVPNSAIALGGSGESRTVTVTPAANQVGSATITLTVSDGLANASSSFTVTVVNTPPTISSIASQTIDAGTSTGPLAFSIGDAQSPATSLVLSAGSSNTTLVPTTGLVLGGSGTARTITVTPAAGQTGTATITVTVSDGLATALTSFTVTVQAVNTAPTISSIANRSLEANRSSGPIGFTVGDAQTAAGSLLVSASSSNTALVPSSGLSLGGTGANRTITVTPATGQTGSATITVRVSDGSLSASTSFTVTVADAGSGGALPTITAIADQVITAGQASDPIGFTIGDADTAVENLTVTYQVSNPVLLPAGTVELGGSGANRTITITPQGNETLTTSIQVTVSDGASSASSSFAVTVVAPIKLVYLPLEAEDGQIVAPMAVIANPQASGGSVISSPVKNDGSVTFNVNIPADGDYVIWCRILSTDYNRDSFHVSVDDGDPDIYDTAENLWSAEFQWTPLNGRGGGKVLTLNPRVIHLTKGAHSIRFQGRDAGTILDRILITNDRQIGVWDY